MAFNECLSCEITNATKRATRFLTMGWALDEIARHLSDVYGESYYSVGNTLYRKSKLYPFTPILIMQIEIKS